jgi:hypothetical protein
MKNCLSACISRIAEDFDVRIEAAIIGGTERFFST